MGLWLSMAAMHIKQRVKIWGITSSRLIKNKRKLPIQKCKYFITGASVSVPLQAGPIFPSSVVINSFLQNKRRYLTDIFMAIFTCELGTER